MTIDHVTFFLLPFLRCDVVVLGGVVLICFVELSFIFVIYILFLKKSGCAVFLECSAPSCDIDETRQVRRARGVGGGICNAPLAALFDAVYATGRATCIVSVVVVRG